MTLIYAEVVPEVVVLVADEEIIIEVVDTVVEEAARLYN